MRLPLAVEEFLPRPTGNYPDCLRTFQSPLRLKLQAVLSRYAERLTSREITLGKAKQISRTEKLIVKGKIRFA